MQKLRQQRADHGTALPPAGNMLIGGAGPGGAAGASGGTRLLMLQSLLTAAFSPNVASGKPHCPPRVLEELRRHRLEPSLAVHAIVSGGSQGGEHLRQTHLASALAPCGEVHARVELMLLDTLPKMPPS